MGKKEEIGKRIRVMRKSRGMTQQDLASYIGQSASSITMYETGRREPDFETLEALADTFNVPLVYLLAEDEDKKEESSNEPSIHHPEIRLLASKLDRLPQEQRDQALDVFNAMYHKFFDQMEDEKK